MLCVLRVEEGWDNKHWAGINLGLERVISYIATAVVEKSVWADECRFMDMVLVKEAEASICLFYIYEATILYQSLYSARGHKNKCLHLCLIPVVASSLSIGAGQGTMSPESRAAVTPPAISGRCLLAALCILKPQRQKGRMSWGTSHPWQLG